MNIKLPENDISFKDKEKQKIWGQPEFALVRPHIHLFRICLDIGAHIGLTTRRYAKYFECVHSFEPIHHICLAENTQHLDNVIIHRCAISDKNGVIQIYPNPKSSGRGIIPDKNNQKYIKKKYTNTNAPLKDVKLITVNCKTIDSFYFQNNIDFIKIDVEGHIEPTIRGMLNTLLKNSPVVQIEMSKWPEYKQTVQTTHKLLTDLGYFPFGKYKEDVFYKKVGDIHDKKQQTTT